jgi:branched-chain amino acid transport system permease protein
LAALTKTYQDNKRIFTYAIYALLAIAALLILQALMGDRPAARLVQSTITGILVGGVYALVAVGIVIVNKASGVFNFAHGSMMVLGALLFYTFFSTSQVSVAAAALLSILATLMVITMGGIRALRKPRNLLIGAGAVVVLTLLMTVGDKNLALIHAITGAVVGAVMLGLVVERFTIRPLIGQPLFAIVLMTLAISEVMLGITQIVWGSVELPLQVFSGLEQIGIPSPLRIDARDALGGNIIIRTELLIAFILAIVAFLAFVAFFRYTNVGLAMRGAAENQQLAQAVGMRVRVILAVAWIIAALLATTAGALQGSANSISQNMAFIALRAFPAVLLGGLESISGALVGGLVIGLVQELGTLLFPNQVGTELAPYVVLLTVLILRPYGLFGEKRIDRI